MRRALALPILALAACGEPIRDDHFANVVEAEVNEVQLLPAEAVPVRIGELGSSFDACSAVGTTRHVAADSTLPVKAAPFDTGEQTTALAAGARFYVCTRTLDQKWFGIIFERNGGLGERCGVSAPVTSPRPYQGECESGWVASAFVKLIAGEEVPAASPERAAN